MNPNDVPVEAALAAVAWDAAGLVPVVAQDASSGDVLTVAYANALALRRTLDTGEAHYWSRSRQELWHKGATSGNVQRVREVRLDCDGDALLYRVDPAGPACHTGERSCFFRAPGDASRVPAEGPVDTAGIGAIMGLLQRVVDERLATLPEGSYVAKLHRRGVGYVAQKVVEEAGETVVAALQGQDEELLGEAADLLFHLTVLLRERGHGLDAVARVLAGRHRGGKAGGRELFGRRPFVSHAEPTAAVFPFLGEGVSAPGPGLPLALRAQRLLARGVCRKAQGAGGSDSYRAGAGGPPAQPGAGGVRAVGAVRRVRARGAASRARRNRAPQRPHRSPPLALHPLFSPECGLEPLTIDPAVGLCSACRHVVATVSDRGSKFFRCGRAKTDPAFAKYPRLPVWRCPGFETPEPAPPGATL